MRGRHCWNWLTFCWTDRESFAKTTTLCSQSMRDWAVWWNSIDPTKTRQQVDRFQLIQNPTLVFCREDSSEKTRTEFQLLSSCLLWPSDITKNFTSVRGGLPSLEILLGYCKRNEGRKKKHISERREETKGRVYKTATELIWLFYFIISIIFINKYIISYQISMFFFSIK